MDVSSEFQTLSAIPPAAARKKKYQMLNKTEAGYATELARELWRRQWFKNILVNNKEVCVLHVQSNTTIFYLLVQ